MGSGTGTKAISPALTNLANVSLLKIGANPVSDLSDGSKNSLKINTVVNYILEEVMQAKDWRFAKLRAALTRNAISPIYGYQYAYKLPTDFLRLALSHYPQTRGLNPVAYPPGYWYQVIDTTGYPRYYNYDPSVYPGGSQFVFEVIPGVEADPDADPPVEAVDDAFCLLTDYDDTDQAIMIDYIRKVTSESVFTPTFKICLVTRLAAELAITITESTEKYKLFMVEYERKLNSAAAVNESLDYVEDETGSVAWENAGR